MICERCGYDYGVGEYPFCKGDPSGHQRGAATVIGDEMDHWQVNGTKTPIHFKSKSARRAWLKATGQEEFVRHQPLPGTDKSAHTSDWSRVTDPYTMNYKRELLERAFAQKPSRPEGGDASIHFRPFDEAELTALDAQYNTRKGVSS
jgi:hypothetical protein